MIKKSIPSFITSLNLGCGILAMLVGNMEWAIFFILLASILDVFDGAAAILLDAKSELGKNLDSLADLVSFGVAPAMLYYKAFGDSEWPFYIGVIIISVGGALRLARFNTSNEESDSFKGFAIPSTAILICGVLLYSMVNTSLAEWLSQTFYYLLFAILIAFLNLSKVSMFSFKGIKKFRIKIYWIILLILAIVLTIFNYKLTLLLGMITYMILSLFENLWKRLQRD